MQGKQALANLERKGPHKSMHCKFCKPPGVVTPEKSSRAQLETKTKIHLAHEAADLRVCNVRNQPGFPAVESEACICVLEGENPCPKCLPDKTRPPLKKKVCRCPKGAKPHPSMFEGTVVKKKKKVEEDDEFWWEKYSREHDATARETWAAYMAQRRKDKKLAKCQIREAEDEILKHTKNKPSWYQKLSCQQLIYLEFLSTAIRLDSDENITDRTYFVLGGLGFHPRPQRKLLKRCLRYCHYNALRFLNQLNMLTKDDDPFKENEGRAKKVVWYKWNEKLIMNSVCHLEFPALLRELMDRLPPLQREELLPQIPYPVFPKSAKKNYKSPYEEPLWEDRLNWLEKTKIDRTNRFRAHMDTKRVKIPALALVRRPSLIDARPPFLAQIEANERASRRLVEEKVQKPVRKHKISTFNSAVDVTAIAGIEASEISTTDKADTDDICVFLREPKESESMEGETEEAEFFPEKEVRFLEEAKPEGTQVKPLSVSEDYSTEGEAERDEIPFKTPPKTESGKTIQSPCQPPEATPAPPAHHYERAKRDIDIVNEEICGFFPFVSSSTQTVKDEFWERDDDVEGKLRSAAEKLKKFAREETDTEGEQKSRKKRKKKKKKMGKKCKCQCKCKCKTRRKKVKSRKGGKRGKKTIVEMPYYSKETSENEVSKGGEGEEEEEEEEREGGEEVEEETQVRYHINEEKEARESESELSDPDPDTDDEWSSRPPCATDMDERGRAGDGRKLKRRRGKGSTKKARKKKAVKQEKGMELREETGEYLKKKEQVAKVEKETMTECYPGEYDHLYKSGEEVEDGQEEEGEEKVGRDVFRGRVGPLVKEIIKDLAEEGFLSASYSNIDSHPLISQLIKYLKGEILTKKLREKLKGMTQLLWMGLKGPWKFPISELGVPMKRQMRADWNDKNWISRLAKKKKDEFYFKVAKTRAEFGSEIYSLLFQEYFGTDRYLKIFYAYMTAKYDDALLRGVI